MTIYHFSKLILFIQAYGRAHDCRRTLETPAIAARQHYPMPRGKRSVGFAAYLLYRGITHKSDLRPAVHLSTQTTRRTTTLG
jgi:hypothetical protein